MTDKPNPTQARVADWVESYPDFYRHGDVAMREPFQIYQIMQVDEPSLRETMLEFFADGWRYMLTGAALASAGACIGLALYFK